MPFLYLSPSTQVYNTYYSGKTNEEEQMNFLANRMEPYLRSSGISFKRNTPIAGEAGAIRESNEEQYDVHLALHTNASPISLSGDLRGIDIYYASQSAESERLANIIANNMQKIYPLPEKTRALPTYTLGEVTGTHAVSVLAELGYHDNPEDEDWLASNTGAIAKSLVKSLCDYFGIYFILAGPVHRGHLNINQGNLNIRSYPSINGTVIGKIPVGAEVNVYGKVDGWYCVGYNGTHGYSSSEFIKTWTDLMPNPTLL